MGTSISNRDGIFLLPGPVPLLPRFFLLYTIAAAPSRLKRGKSPRISLGAVSRCCKISKMNIFFSQKIVFCIQNQGEKFKQSCLQTIQRSHLYLEICLNKNYTVNFSSHVQHLKLLR
jgi:hypothetical protein